jgi:hypothetical protein
MESALEELKRMDSVEQCSNRATPLSRTAANCRFRTKAVNGVKIVLVRHLHAWQCGEVVSLVNTLDSFSHRRPIEYRAFKKLRSC